MTEFDVAISFAGEQRAEAQAIAECLKKAGLRVFYDGYEVVDMWGKNLYDHLSDVYQNKAEYCLMLVSRQYAEKVWPNHERKSAQARAMNQREEYLLPVRFDNTEIPGLLPTVAYLKFQDYGVPGICKALLQKLGRLGPDPQSEWNSFHEEPLTPPLLNVESAEKLLGTLNMHSFFATRKTAEGEFRAPNHLRLIAIPRPVLSLRLDRVVQKRFKHLIRSAFLDVGNFDQEVPRGQFYQVESHSDRRSSTHRVWMVWSSGAIGYTANLIPRHPATEVPVGDLACDHIFFSRLAQQFFSEQAHLGIIFFYSLLACRNIRFSPHFPPPDGDVDDYDHIPGLKFPGEHPYCKESCEMIHQEDMSSLSRGQEGQIADTLLYQLTETKGASIEHLKLLEAVVNLSRQSSYSNWGKDR